MKPQKGYGIGQDGGERASGAAGELDALLHDSSREILESVLDAPHVTERHLLILLARKNLPREIVARIAANREWMGSYRMKLAVLKHPRTPRDHAIRLLKFIYLFDLLTIALTPGVSAELKRLAEDAILAQKMGLALGQRISLARRGSLRVVSRLLDDSNSQVIDAALANPVLTDHAVAAALLIEGVPATLTKAVLKHQRWSVRKNVKLALLRNPHVSLARLMEILPDLTKGELADAATDRRVDPSIRVYAHKAANSRTRRGIQ